MQPIRFLVFLILCFFNFQAWAQLLRENKKFSRQLQRLVVECGLDSTYEVGETEKEQVSLAVIDLNGRAVLGGVNIDNFIYPASVYKMYVAMEILKQVSRGDYTLNRTYIVRSPNDVDRNREVSFDPRPLLRDGDTVTVNYLLDLMITRSDNTAANCLIDIAGRKKINVTMQQLGWEGSEITRKFLKRSLEDPGYDSVRGTQTNGRHAAEFMFRITNQTLVNPWVSLQMKALLARQLDKSKFAQGLPLTAMMSHKTGWWSHYTHDVGIVEDGKIRYVVVLLTPIRESHMNGRMKKLAEKLHVVMRQKQM